MKKTVKVFQKQTLVISASEARKINNADSNSTAEYRKDRRSSNFLYGWVEWCADGEKIWMTKRKFHLENAFSSNFCNIPC